MMPSMRLSRRLMLVGDLRAAAATTHTSRFSFESLPMRYLILIASRLALSRRCLPHLPSAGRQHPKECIHGHERQVSLQGERVREGAATTSTSRTWPDHQHMDSFITNMIVFTRSLMCLPQRPESTDLPRLFARVKIFLQEKFMSAHSTPVI